MMMLEGSDHAEVIVVGAGAVGAAATYQLAARGVRVLAIDRYAPPHAFGSSHGETRVTREATGEGAEYVPLVRRSHQIWSDLEKLSGECLFNRVGFLTIDGSGGAALRHGKLGFFDTTVAAARENSIPHEVLSVGEASARFPQFALLGDERVYFEPGGGVVYPERAIAVQLSEAKRLGARLINNCTVLAIDEQSSGVTVQTTAGAVYAEHVVVCAGAWAPQLVAAPELRLLRQTLHWFGLDDEIYAPDRCPTFLWLDGPRDEDMFYGFPTLPGGTLGIKVATEQFTAATASADMTDREVTAAESAEMYHRFVAGRLRGVGNRVARASACLYAYAPGGQFQIDYAQGSQRVLRASACSGHGFKHSAAVGELLAGIVTGTATAPPCFQRSKVVDNGPHGGAAAHRIEGSEGISA